jgi:hypothetical protein
MRETHIAARHTVVFRPRDAGNARQRLRKKTEAILDVFFVMIRKKLSSVLLGVNVPLNVRFGSKTRLRASTARSPLFPLDSTFIEGTRTPALCRSRSEKNRLTS